MQPTIYVDLRPLQDENYRVRGIGQHIAALLRARKQSAFVTHTTVGLVDAQLPELQAEFHPLVDEISYSINPSCKGGRGIFIDGSPMGHDSRFTARFMNQPAFLKATVIYDFIPFDWPGYLPTVASRIHYSAKLARLKNFDIFFPISQYSARRTAELLGVSNDRVVMTGAAVRRSIYDRQPPSNHTSSPYDKPDPYFFITYGGDVRKNIEIAIKAVRHLNLVYARRIPLKIAGHYDLKGAGYYDQAWKRNLLRLAGITEGDGFLDFCPGVSDQELVELYSGAIATIVPSHIEGFSLPVVEASVCGCPVIASSCEAHLELINQPEALFDSHDLPALCGRLDALLNNAQLRESLKIAQASLSSKFHEDTVGRSFWSGLAGLVKNLSASPAIGKSTKPRLAFLSAFSLDGSNAALYTANAMQAGEEFFSADLYTNSPRPLSMQGGFQDAGKISQAPFLAASYDAIVSIIGTSPGDLDVFSIFQQWGGPCILHEIPPFLESIVKRALPLLVHSSIDQVELMRRYGVDAAVLPFCPATLFVEAELSAISRNAARKRLGITPGAFAVSIFVDVAEDKGLHTCIAAIDLLHSWNLPAEIHLIGNTAEQKHEINRVAALYGMESSVHVTPFISKTSHREYLLASDAALQVKSASLGQPPGSLMDSISAGLPCVTTRHLAISCDAPAYVRTVPDRFSALQVAEQLALIWECKAKRDCYADTRAAYLEKHNFSYYAQRLVEILGVV